MAPSATPTRYLVIGPNGWIGQKLVSLLHSQNADVHTTLARMEDMASISAALDEIKPDCVINCAGKTGRPNIDWCEDHRVETVESNVIGTLVVASECAKRGIHLTVLATGCKSPSSS
jgi:3,5-epimerase/4-reductase